MGNIKKIALCLVFSLYSFNAFAEGRIDDELAKCLNAATQTVAIVDCYKQANTAWDQEMNVQYKLLRLSAAPETHKYIEASQRSWLEYRESYIAALQKYYGTQGDGGSLWGVVIAQGIMNITRDKALDLKRTLAGADSV